jgi:hypothetical protein
MLDPGRRWWLAWAGWAVLDAVLLIPAVWVRGGGRVVSGVCLMHVRL